MYVFRIVTTVCIVLLMLALFGTTATLERKPERRAMHIIQLVLIMSLIAIWL